MTTAVATEATAAKTAATVVTEEGTAVSAAGVSARAARRDDVTTGTTATGATTAVTMTGTDAPARAGGRGPGRRPSTAGTAAAALDELWLRHEHHRRHHIGDSGLRRKMGNTRGVLRSSMDVLVASRGLWILFTAALRCAQWDCGSWRKCHVINDPLSFACRALPAFACPVTSTSLRSKARLLRSRLCLTPPPLLGFATCPSDSPPTHDRYRMRDRNGQ